jgi:hypothetical protein
MPRWEMFSDSAVCSVDPGLLSARNLKGTRIFTRVSIRRSLELMVSSPLAGMNARGYQIRKGVKSILARRGPDARKMRIFCEVCAITGQVVP